MERVADISPPVLAIPTRALRCNDLIHCDTEKLESRMTTEIPPAAQRQRLVVCVLAVSQNKEGRRLLLQRRNKDNDDTPYSGYVELPQGKVEANESLIDAARRELSEEAGLILSGLICGGEEPVEAGQNSDLYASSPPICVADRLQNHIGIAIVATVTGSVCATNEADKQGWYSDLDVKALINQGAVFPLNRPMLSEYLKHPDWALQY
jgi:8-oxo-dGTP pyrophosphatase MutT (NUDIX family)